MPPLARNMIDFGVESSLWLDFGAQHRHYNNEIKALSGLALG